MIPDKYQVPAVGFTHERDHISSSDTAKIKEQLLTPILVSISNPVLINWESEVYQVTVSIIWNRSCRNGLDKQPNHQKEVHCHLQ